ncbi:UNVERIFIED_CONTAM: ribosomal protein S7, partial [Bacteroidetes bacterium 56_B9]
QNLLEYKLDTFSSVYRQLAGKDVHFEYVTFPLILWLDRPIGRWSAWKSRTRSMDVSLINRFPVQATE